MYHKIKILFFHLCRLLGIFWLSRRLLHKKLRILCYHGFSILDEHEFRPGLFIEPDVFARRMQYLADKKYNIISLQEAYELKEKRLFPDDAVVLTIDDGFYSVLKLSLPILRKHNFPATLYLTSYYFDKNSPVFRLAVDYMFFKTKKINIPLETLAIPGLFSQDDSDASEKIITYGIQLETEDQRIDILKKLGTLLDVDYEALNVSRILNLITLPEINDLLDGGIDIQLHTHRHRFPTDYETASYEIEKNKKIINPHLRQPMTHFCYPNGVWGNDHWPVLEDHKILTATTCVTGLIDYDTPNYSLDRILDDMRISQIEFEAEISGFNELIRLIRRK